MKSRMGGPTHVDKIHQRAANKRRETKMNVSIASDLRSSSWPIKVQLNEWIECEKERV